MDYEGLAHEYIEVMHQMRRHKAQKQLSDSMHGENFVLFFIYKHEGNVIPSDLSNEMGITSARIAATLNSLEGKGYITRRIDVEDRRRILVDLTEAGTQQVQKQQQMIMKAITNMLQYIGEDDAKDFIRIMKKLADKGPEDFM